MERETEERRTDLIELGTASRDTHGGPVGRIELTGLRPYDGISDA